MGCASSTELSTDPATGQKKHKHKLGGAYPGNRRTPQQGYTPGASEFNSQGQATAHFVSYGGGNALVLQQNGIAQPQSGQPVGKQPTYIQVTLPSGVNSGDKIHVQAPDGRLNEIIVPPGFGPGSTFTVEFADDPSPPPPPSRTPTQSSSYTAPVAPATTYHHNNNNNHNNDVDDGFATGFRNPNFVPPTSTAPTATATATSYGAEEDVDLSAYPSATAHAQPVYSSTPTYEYNTTPYVK